MEESSTAPATSNLCPDAAPSGQPTSSSGPTSSPAGHADSHAANPSPRGGEKRKAEDDLPEESERVCRGDAEQEIPIPDAGPVDARSGPAPSAEVQSEDADEGALKRPLEEHVEEREFRRARLEALCALCHGCSQEYKDVDLKSLIAAANSEPAPCEAGATHQCTDQEEEWGLPWWTQENRPDVEKELGPGRINEAKRKEIQSFKEREVYEVVSRSEAEKPGAIKLSTKWVITNKGTKSAPVAKARLVAREFVSDRIDRDTLFAGTPGLASMKLLLSRAASTGRGPQLRVMILDVKTAFLYGLAKRDLYIELPAHDPHSADPTKVGKLRRALYGTRDAPQLWAEHCGATLRRLGFTESVVMQGVYVHAKREVEFSIHVDDFH